MYHVGSKKFVRLADDDLRTVTLAPKHKFAIGLRRSRVRADGQSRRPPLPRRLRHRSRQPAQRKLALKRARWFNGPSPDGESLLYYEDGHFHVYSMKTGTVEEHHHGRAGLVHQHRERPQHRRSADAADGMDEGQQVGPDQRQLGHLADPGRRRQGREPDRSTASKDAIRYRGRIALEPIEERDDGIDLIEAAILHRLRRMDEEGWHRAPRSRASRGHQRPLG